MTRRYHDQSALIVTDIQNDFADPAGNLYVAGGEAIIELVNEEIRRANEAGALVVYTQDWHPEETPHFHTSGGIWPVHCVRDTWGSEFHPALEVGPGEFLRKGTGGEDGYSAFTVRDPSSGATAPTVLELLLRGHDVRKVVIVGIAADVCVKDTALDALALGFATTVLQDGTRGVDLQPGDTERAFAQLREAGARIE